MIDLNNLKKITLKIGAKRIKNGANLSFDFLKHCAGELVEAVNAKFSYENAVVYSEDKTALEESKKNYADELADVIICVLNEAEKADIDIEKAIFDAVEKNRKRAEGIGDKL